MLNGFSPHLGNLSELSRAKTRSISPENFTGEKGKGGMAIEGTGAPCARDLGRGWKISPFVKVGPGQTCTLADVEGPGVIQQVWMTLSGHWRFIILRVWWDGDETPSIEVPIGDFLCMGWCEYAHVNSLAVCVNPHRAFNCYWPMPFRKHCRMTLENLGEEEFAIYYQINYALTEVSNGAGYLHAQFRRSNPLPYKETHPILEGVHGHGHYVGTYMACGVNNTGWWGEGEIKFYLDGDTEWPTVCGTGAEDYFCGACCFKVGESYAPYSTAYAGMPQVILPDGVYRSQQRFGLYRWHILDPIVFERDLRVTIQALGWRSGGRYLPLQDDIASVAYWYQAEPHAPFPALPDKDALEVI
jgi:hypothetical protein